MLLSRPQNQLVGNELDANDAVRIGEVAGRALFDPGNKGFICQAVPFEADAPFMRHGSTGLGDDQARFRHADIHPAAEEFLADGIVIQLWVRAAERELEAIFPQRVAVAGPRVATRLGKHRHHLMSEAARRRGGGKLDFDRHAERLPRDDGGQLCFTAGDRPDQSFVIDNRNFWIGNGELCLCSQVQRISVGGCAEQLHGLDLPVMAKIDGGRMSGDGAGGRRIVGSEQRRSDRNKQQDQPEA